MTSPAPSVQSKGHVVSLAQGDWGREVRQSARPAFVEFWAPWCGPCKVMGPLVKSLAEEYAGKAKFFRVNVDESQKLVERFQVFSVPTFMIFNRGQPSKRFVGMATREYMADMLKPLLGS